MTKYHLTEDGPKPCHAKVRACPVGGEHFEGKKAADLAFQETLAEIHSAAPPKLSKSKTTTTQEEKPATVTTADEFKKSAVWKAIQEEDEKNDPYYNTEFYKFKHKPPATKGAIGEGLVSEKLEELGYTVSSRVKNVKDYDRIVNGKKIEIKTSFRWKNGSYVWQQIRPHQDYDYLIMVAVKPEGVFYYGVSKEKCDEYLSEVNDKGELKHVQHGGKVLKELAAKGDKSIDVEEIIDDEELSADEKDRIYYWIQAKDGAFPPFFEDLTSFMKENHALPPKKQES